MKRFFLLFFLALASLGLASLLVVFIIVYQLFRLEQFSRQLQQELEREQRLAVAFADRYCRSLSKKGR